MSDATEQPAPEADADAWEKACAEDLAEEKARRRAEYGPPPGSAAEELRKLVDAVAEKLSGLQTPFSVRSPRAPRSRSSARSSSRRRRPSSRSSSATPKSSTISRPRVTSCSPPTAPP